MIERYVRMKPLKQLIRGKVIELIHISDDGEYIRFKVIGQPGVEHGMWNPGNDKLLVVDCETIHVNMLKMCPQLFEEAE